MKKQNAVVYCRKSEHDTLAFYLRLDGEEIFLFNTDYYSNSIYHEYYNSKRTDKLFETSENFRYQKLTERIIRMIKWIETEYSVSIFRKSSVRSCCSQSIRKNRNIIPESYEYNDSLISA